MTNDHNNQKETSSGNNILTLADKKGLAAAQTALGGQLEALEAGAECVSGDLPDLLVGMRITVLFPAYPLVPKLNSRHEGMPGRHL